MAKIFALPNCEEWEMKEGESFDEYWARQEKMLAELEEQSNRVADGETQDTIGYIYTAPYADGQAMYLVWSEKPLQLCHIPFGDAWRLPEAHERGLRLGDIKKQIQFEKRWKDLVKEGGE